MKYKDFTLAYGGAGLYHASLIDDPEYGTPFVVSAGTDEKAWEKLKACIDAESCECGRFIKDFDEEEKCTRCRTNPAKEFVKLVNENEPGTFPTDEEMRIDHVEGDVNTFNDSENLAA